MVLVVSYRFAQRAGAIAILIAESATEQFPIEEQTEQPPETAAMRSVFLLVSWLILLRFVYEIGRSTAGNSFGPKSPRLPDAMHSAAHGEAF